MLQEWLEELAEDELKKTASSKLEEGLSELSVDELKGFLSITKEASSLADVAYGGMSGLRRAGFGAGVGGMGGASGGAALGGITGALSADEGERAQGALSGLRRGAVVGGLTGAGIGGASALAKNIPGQIAAPMVGATLGGISPTIKAEESSPDDKQRRLIPEDSTGDPRFEPGPEDYKSAYSSPEVMAIKEKLLAENPDMSDFDLNTHPDMDKAVMNTAWRVPKQASKTKMAIDAGRALAHVMAKQAQAPAPIQEDPFAPRVVRAPEVDREKFVGDAASTGKAIGIGGGRFIGGAGGALAGGALGNKLLGVPGAAAGALIGGGLGSYGLGRLGGRFGEGVGRRTAEGMSDEEMQAAEDYDLARKLFERGDITEREFNLAAERMDRAGVQGGLQPQLQQFPSQPQPFAEKTGSFKNAVMSAAQKGAISKYEWEL